MDGRLARDKDQFGSACRFGCGLLDAGRRIYDGQIHASFGRFIKGV